MNAKELITFFDLAAHPEGGFYKEIYRSSGEILPENLGAEFIGKRNFCTSIYFLLTSHKFSAFHKINQDEIWHFYKGSAIKLHMISPKGIYSNVLIGNNFIKDEVPQFTVPAQYYFAAEVLKKDGFAFTGCTVSPGFDFRDFDLPTCKKLTSMFPEHKDIIEKMTHY